MQKPEFKSAWRNRLHEIVFEADTFAGKAFDITIICSIVLSVAAVMLDSIASFHEAYGPVFYSIEWFFTIVFTVEYVLRLASVGRPIKYAKSFFGVIDLVAIIPTYLSVILPGSEYFLAVRIIRVLRIFRVLKFAHYIAEANLITSALWETRRKITVFIAAVLTLVVVLGSLMYLIEGGQNGFTSIPKSIYWAIVTMTTVGYGDIAPKTALGQAMASFIMILGYGILAVPTGIVTVGLAKAASQKVSTQACPECSAGGHDYDAKFCKFCGARL